MNNPATMTKSPQRELLTPWQKAEEYVQEGLG